MKLTKIEIFSIIMILGLSILFFIQLKSFNQKLSPAAAVQDNHNNIVLPAAGIEIPVKWGDSGSKLVDTGVIDGEKFMSLYRINGKLDEETEKLISGIDNGNIKITPLNSALILNLFWALGLGNKNKILEEGPTADSRYGDPGRFASTGGWTLAKVVRWNIIQNINLLF